jgi:hypothetical protein
MISFDAMELGGFISFHAPLRLGVSALKNELLDRSLS